MLIASNYALLVSKSVVSLPWSSLPAWRRSLARRSQPAFDRPENGHDDGTTME